MVNMAINNFHPDSVTVSVVASSLDNTLVNILSGAGVVVPHKISELEYVVHNEVAKLFYDFHIKDSIKTELIFDQEIVEVKVFKTRGMLDEHLFSITADRWEKQRKAR